MAQEKSCSVGSDRDGDAERDLPVETGHHVRQRFEAGRAAGGDARRVAPRGPPKKASERAERQRGPCRRGERASRRAADPYGDPRGLEQRSDHVASSGGTNGSAFVPSRHEVENSTLHVLAVGGTVQMFGIRRTLQ